MQERKKKEKAKENNPKLKEKMHTYEAHSTTQDH